MNFFQRIWHAISPPPVAATVIGRVSPAPSSPRIPVGRVSFDTANPYVGSAWILAAPQDYTASWRTISVDHTYLRLLAANDLLNVLTDLSPEMSRAYWDLLRLCNPGWELKAYNLGDDESEHPQGQALLDDFMLRLRDDYGAVDVIWNRLFGATFLRGAVCTELVLGRDRRTMIDLATPDPQSIRFRKRVDPLRGEVWQPGQWQAGQFVELNIPTFRYVPIDPFPASPYGRPLAAPALFNVIFLLDLLHDIRRVVMQQGYKRLDIEVSTEQAHQAYVNDPAALSMGFGDYVGLIVKKIEEEYRLLQPDEAFVHTDAVKINSPVGTADSDSIGALSTLIDSITEGVTRALKTNSLLMGGDDSLTESNGNRRWEIHVAGVKSLQHFVENAVGSLLETGLRAAGVQARVELRFAELRAAEELRDAQVDQLKIANAAAKRDQGWYDQDEASMEVTGHDAVEEAPTAPGEPSGPGGLPTLPDEGESLNQDESFGGDVEEGTDDLRPPSQEERAAARRARVKLIPDGAAEPLPAVPETVEISDADVQRALDEWNDLMRDYAGLLEAEVINRQAYEEEARADAGSREPPGRAWRYDANTHRYRDSRGRFLSNRQMVDLRDTYSTHKQARMSGLAADLANGAKNLAEFNTAFQREIKSAFIDEYVLGKGGRNNMTQSDWGRVGTMVREQYQYARVFAQEIAAGKLSEREIAARASLYMSSSTQAYERGHVASYGTLTLPAHPADGSTVCRSNDRCTWVIQEDDENWYATWRLMPGENCRDCLDRAARWNPLVVPKQRRSAGDLTRVLEEHANGHESIGAADIW